MDSEEHRDASSFEKISPTAKLVAYLRTFTDIPYAKEIAKWSEAEAVYRQIHGEGAESTIRLAPYWEARYKVTNRILEESRTKQVLEVAAGLSPRGLEMTRNPEVVYVTTDLEEMLETERLIAARILESESNAPRPNLHFAVANALEMESLLSAVAPFAHSKPIAVITEGLVPYLDRDERVALARNIKRLLLDFHGIWIASDVRTRQSFREAAQLDKSAGRRSGRLSALVGRRLADNLFEDERDLEGFFERAGFAMKEYAYSDVLPELASVGLLKLSEQEVRSIRAAFVSARTLVLTRRAG